MSDGHEINVSDFNLSTMPATSIRDTVTYDNLNLQEIEKILVEKALDKHQGNISKAAKELGLTRAALYRRLEKFNI
jgi:transcriptional regulator of acetoin/glycerol metabolism